MYTKSKLNIDSLFISILYIFLQNKIKMDHKLKIGNNAKGKCLTKQLSIIEIVEKLNHNI